jgi:hypothetical protein
MGIKLKHSSNTSWRLVEGGMLGFHHYFDIQHNLDGKVVRSKRRPHFTPKEIPWCSLLLEAEWTSGLLNADFRPLKNFHGPHRESDPGPPILWYNASTSFLGMALNRSIWGFLENLSVIFKFNQNLTGITVLYMKYVHSWQHPAELFLKWEIFQTNCTENQNTFYIL